MSLEVALVFLLVGAGLFAACVSDAVRIVDKPTAFQWVKGVYVLAFLFFPWIGLGLVESGYAIRGAGFAMFCSLFYLFCGAALGYETGVAAERRRSTNFPIA